MPNVQRWVALGAAALMVSTPAPAAVISLFEYAFNIDGTVTTTPAPAVVSLGGFDTATGLGTVTVSLSGPGSHYVGMFSDHEIDEAINTFFNEYGATLGTPAAGQSWEIDEPGYVFGDIYNNFLASALDGTNGVPVGSPDDVSMAMAWSFILGVDETATLSFVVSQTAPTGGFYLWHTDPGSPADLYLSSSLNVRQGGGQIPEPATFGLVGLSLLGLWGSRRRGAS